MNDAIEIKDSAISGKGMFAKIKFPKGSTVIKWQPKILTKEQAEQLPEKEKQYYLYPEGDKFLWMQPPERYINHSCEPNTRVVGYSDIAIKDIEPGEEITSDYMDLETENFKCRCGSAKCRNPS